MPASLDLPQFSACRLCEPFTRPCRERKTTRIRRICEQIVQLRCHSYLKWLGVFSLGLALPHDTKDVLPIAIIVKQINASLPHCPLDM